MKFSPDGKTVLTGSKDASARLWDLNGNTLQEYKCSDIIFSVDFLPDGKTVLIGSLDGTARLLNVPTPLENFLKSDKIESLTEEQKKNFEVKE